MKTRIALIALATWLVSEPAHSEWALNGTGVCTLAGGQHHPVATADGGGVIIAWEDSRNAATSGIDIYAQRLGPDGHVLWDPGGTPVCTEPGDQQFPTIVSSGLGAAVIAWGDARTGSYTVYAQRIGTNGYAVWASGGVPLCTAMPEQNFPIAVRDQSNGAIVSWLDTRTGDFDIYAQRVDALGNLQWASSGVPICAALGLQHSPFVAPSTFNGALMAWTDERGATPDIYGQKIDGNGAAQWAPNGLAVCTAVRMQSGVSVASDGIDGAIFVWADGRLGDSSTLRDIYAQRMSNLGFAQWTANGVPVCTASLEQGFPAVVTADMGGAILAWHDFRNGNWDVYAQRMNGAGVAQWTANGVALCTATGTQSFVSGISDGAGGAIVAWPDGRDGSNDVYAQRIDATGAVRWPADGVALCALPRAQSSPVLVSDKAGGAIVAWDDQRSWDGVTGPSDLYSDIYANRVDAGGWAVTGVTHAPSARSVLTQNVPNPFSETTSFDLVLDHHANVAVDVFDVAGHKVRHIDLASVKAGRSTIAFDGHDARGHLLPSGAYFYRVSANGEQLTRKMLIVR